MNGKLCQVKHIKLKDGAPPLQWKNWNSFKVYTTSERYMEWAEFERFLESEKIQPKKFIFPSSKMKWHQTRQIPICINYKG